MSNTHFNKGSNLSIYACFIFLKYLSDNGYTSKVEYRVEQAAKIHMVSADICNWVTNVEIIQPFPEI